MRHRILASLLLFSCQPIMIGNPQGTGGANAGGNDPGGGSSTNASGGTLPSGGADAAGGATGSAGHAGSLSNGGTATSVAAGAPNEAGAAAGDASNAGAGGEGGAASGDAGDQGVFEPQVLVVVYDPLLTGLSDPAQSLSTTLGVETAPYELGKQLASELADLTGGHIRHIVLPGDVSEVFPPMTNGFRYDPSSYQACLNDAKACYAGAADYAAIASERHLCDLAHQGNADQIWLLGAKRFGFAMGKQLTCAEAPGEPGSARLIDFINLDYSQGLTSLLTSYQAQSEFVLRQVFGVPAAVATTDDPTNPFGLFEQTQGRAPSAPASGCGDATFAPNSLTANRFDDPRSAPSYCETFLALPRLAPLAAARSISCQAWGCTEIGYRRYWLQHLPRARWSDAQNRLNDFWRYVLHPSERGAPEKTSVACSSSYLPGWCANVLHAEASTCNVDEWATSNQPTGFVDFRFVPPRAVTGVQLHDRACVERVWAGHVEFSDGSPDVPFGPLEDLGQDPEQLTFPAKLLSGLRVVIDDTMPPTDSNWNPGFGNITITP